MTTVVGFLRSVAQWLNEGRHLYQRLSCCDKGTLSVQHVDGTVNADMLLSKSTQAIA